MVRDHVGVDRLHHRTLALCLPILAFTVPRDRGLIVDLIHVHQHRQRDMAFLSIRCFTDEGACMTDDITRFVYTLTILLGTVAALFTFAHVANKGISAFNENWTRKETGVAESVCV